MIARDYLDLDTGLAGQNRQASLGGHTLDASDAGLARAENRHRAQCLHRRQPAHDCIAACHALHAQGKDRRAEQQDEHGQTASEDVDLSQQGMLDTSAREAISRIGTSARSAVPSWMKPITALVIITARMTALFAHPPRKVVKAAATSRILDENVLGLLDEAFQRSLFFFPRELIWSVLFKPLPASDLVRSCEGGNIVRSTCVTCGLQKELRTGFKNVRGYTLPAHGKRALGQGPFF